MPWKEVTRVSERLKLCNLALEEKYSITDLSKSFGVSRKTIYKWLKEYELSGAQGVFDRSRRPKSSPSQISFEVESRIIELRNMYDSWGARKLHKLLIDEMGIVCSRSTVDRILLRHGLRDRIEPKPREEAVGRFERGKPNELWQIDFTSPFTASNGIKIWPVPILDDRARFCVELMAAPSCTGECALECFMSAARNYGLPDEVLSDHGSTFGTSRSYISAFTAYLMALEVKHIQGRYAHPQTQGKLERFNRTLKKECITKHSYSDINDWQKCFDDYRHLYNEIRPHESLLDETPSSVYVRSDRVFVEPKKNKQEQIDGVLQRKVDRSGKIWLFQHQIKVGGGLAGWTVSAKHDGNGFWTISFKDREICQVGIAKTAKYQPRP